VNFRPLYVLVAGVAAVPSLDTAFAKALNGAQLEGVLFSLLILISTQTAWVAAMSRWGDDETSPRTESMTFQ
jgi:hypothetical protein